MNIFSGLHLGCAVDKSLTTQGLWFIIFVFLSVAIFYFFFQKKVKDPLAQMTIMFLGVLIFEVFTSPMWDNPHLGVFSYFYKDVSWVLSLGWSVMMLSSLWIADIILPKARELARFLLALFIMTVAGMIAEGAVLALGLRIYSPEVISALHGMRLAGVPLEALYYIPVFSALVMGFYKYWTYLAVGSPAVPIKKGKFARNLLITFFAVIMFELMVDPMVENRMLPEWSYLYRDISIIFSGTWILLVFIAEAVVERYFLHRQIVERFLHTLFSIAVLAIPLEGWLMANGFRVYGESASRDFIGLTMPIIGTPIEVLFAIPLYFGLILSLSKYIQFCLDNKK